LRISAKLDSSVEASGPHDFAVRVCAIRQERSPASIASRPAFVTIAKRPFEEQNARIVKVICPTPEAKYFLRRDWTGSISLSRFNKFAVTRKPPALDWCGLTNVRCAPVATKFRGAPK
jgi:hypothetical protein